jgi:methyl-accepting chemotaxis protein
VFAGLFDNGEFTSSHLFVVLSTGLVFFAVQLMLSARFSFRMSRQERAINSLSRAFERGDPAQQQLPARSGESDWVQWVLANYKNASGMPCNFTRDDAFDELDARIAGSGDYLLLQRMGVMAPLLGVVLTVIGFFWLEISERDQSLQTILLAVAPLVSGVGAGAVLALINQALLHVAGHCAESLRMTARNWFDAAIWSQVDLEARAATGRATIAMDRLGDSISDASARYANAANQIHESTASMGRAAVQFHDIVQRFGAEIKGIPDALEDVRRATTVSAEALDELIRIGSRAAANLDVSVAAFRTTIDREFTDAAKLQHRSSQELAKSAQRFEDATERIQSGSHHLNRTAQANEAAFLKMDESIQRLVLTGYQQFQDAVESLTGRVAAFSQEVDELASIVEAVAGEFNKVTGGLVPSFSALRDTIDKRFAAAVTQQTTQVEAVNQSMGRLREAADGMSQGSTTLNAMLQQLSQFVSQSRAAHETLAQTAGNLAEVGKHLQQSMKSDAATSQQTLDEISTSLYRFTKHLNEFVSAGLDPATQRLAVLHDTLADFEEAVDSLYEPDDTAPDTTHASSGVDHAENESQRRFVSWLSRRPR